jgi:hypothetical protein
MYVKDKIKVECNKKDKVVLAKQSFVNKVVVHDFLGVKISLNRTHALFLKLKSFHQLQVIVTILMTTEAMFGTNLMDM